MTNSPHAVAQQLKRELSPIRGKRAYTTTSLNLSPLPPLAEMAVAS